MNLVLGFLVVAVVSGVAIAAMLLVRRRAPEGSYFTDGDRASGVFGVLATGFSVLLGFIIFLAFTSYDQSRSGRRDRGARCSSSRSRRRSSSRPTSRAELTGELVCYGRYGRRPGVGRDGGRHAGDAINPWGVALFQTLAGGRAASRRRAVRLRQVARPDVRPARRRVATASTARSGVIPTPLWIVLFFISGVIFVYMLFFADSGERAVTQALLMGSVAAVITTMLLLLAFLDNPFQRASAVCSPVAMERTLRHRRRGARARSATTSAPPATRGAAARDAPAPRARSDRLEIVATVLLALATVATAWSGYQASRWNGEQAKAFSRANAARIESTRASGAGRSRRRQIDVATFTQWVDAYAREETRARRLLLRALSRRVRAGRRRLDRDEAAPEPGRPADAVRHARSTSSPRAPRRSSWRPRPRSGRPRARVNVQRATNYVLGVVLFAAALFFAGHELEARHAPDPAHHAGDGGRGLPSRRRVAGDAADQLLGLSSGFSRGRRAPGGGRRRSRR